VREIRALEAAAQLGLLCEHQLTEDHFYYVMPYVKGEDLDRVGRTLHARSGNEGLGDHEVALVLGYAIDVLDHLQRFHSGGLWHKDVKPANIIVASGRAHLVDFGLVTPLSSALTLTTHGTEYYRDPEMVRLALQGVKVHEVDGVRFDVYSAGAVLFSLIENSFPAHGSLSRIGKRCPEALRWIVQRAMAEMSARYPTAQAMRADLAALAAARDPFVLRPADLPSLQPTGPMSPVVPAPELAAAPPPLVATPASFPPPPAEPEPLRRVFPAPAAASAPYAAPAPRRRGWKTAVALAAAGLFGLFTLSAASTLFLGVSHHHRTLNVPATLDVPPPEAPWTSRLPERDRQVVELAQGVADDLGASSAEAEPATLADGAPTTEGELDLDAEAAGLLQAEVGPPAADAAAVATPPEPAPASRGRVLVLDDPTGVDARVLALLRSKLVERHFTIVGSEGDAETAVEELAGARVALGLGHPEDPETQGALQRFLDATPTLAALMVVSRSEPDGEHVYRVFVRDPGARSDEPR